MSENIYKNIDTKSKRMNSKLSKGLFSVLDGSFLTKNKIVELLPFFFYLMGLALLLIFNSYYAERKVREKEELRLELIELRIKYITTKSELMFITNQSEIARNLEESGLVESTVPPRVIAEPKQKRGFLLNIFDRSKK